MKRALRILLLVIAVILVLNIALVALFSNKSVQGKLLSYGEDWLEEKTGTELSLGYVSYDLLSGLYVEDLYVEDMSGDTLLYAGVLKAKVGLLTLLDLDDIRIKKVELDNFVVHIDKESDSTFFNFQFLIDAFRSDEKSADDTSSFGLKIDDIVLRNGYVTYDVNDAPQTADQFNGSHIACRGLQMEGSFVLGPKGDITVAVDHLSLREQSGLRVEDLETKILLKDDHLVVSRLALSLPKSRVTMSADCILDSRQFSTMVQSDSISLADLAPFAPMLASMTDSASFSFLATGAFPAVWVTELMVDYPSVMNLKSSRVKISDCLDWEHALYDVRVEELSVASDGASRILAMVGGENPEMLASYLPAQARLTYKGTLSDGNFSTGITAPVGRVEADGTLQYKPNVNYLGCDLSLRCADVALDTLLRSDDFKSLTMTSDVKVAWRMDQNPNILLSAKLSDFSYRNYAYDTLRLSARYLSQDTLISHWVVNDPNLNGEVWLNGANLTGEKPRFSAKAMLNHFAPAVTHLSDSLGNAHISGAFSANLTDFNDLLGEIAIDSLHLVRDSSEIHWTKPVKMRHKWLSDGNRQLTFSSPAVEADLKGAYEFSDFYPAVVKVMRHYWPDLLKDVEVEDPAVAVNVDFNVQVKEVEDLAEFLGQEIVLPSGALVNGNLSVPDNAMSVKVDVPLLAVGKRWVQDVTLQLNADGSKLRLNADVVADSSTSGASEMMRVRLNSVVTRNQMEGVVYTRTFPDTSFVRGSLPFTIYSTIDSASGRMNMSLLTQSTDLLLMGYRFGLTPAEIHQQAEKIVVKNIGITLDDNVLLRMEGLVSDQLQDTLEIRFDRVNLEPIVSALARRHIPLQCAMDGEVQGSALLGEQMHIQTNNLRFDSIVYEGISLGDLSVNMRWNNERKGLLSKMILTKGGKQMALVQGVVKPAEKSLKMVTSLDSLPLDIFSPFIENYVTETRGNIGASILAEGTFDDLALEGRLFFKDLHAKVKYTGVGYTLSDTIKFERNKLRVDHFCFKDDNGHLLTVRGDVSHEKFKRFDYNLLVNMDDFLLLNNPKAKSNIVSGLFYANAKNVTVQGTDSHMKVRGEFSNGDNTTLNILLPESVAEVQTYDNIVYVKPAEEVADTIVEGNGEMPLDLDADILVKLSDQATFYVNVADGAMVNGNGNLRVVYQEGNVSLYNRYTVNSGYVKIKLSEIPAKKFSIQQGGYVQFNGDPMKLTFDATACYDLTADLATLSKGFMGMGLGSTRQPVRCGAHATGSLSEMNLTYDITLPSSTDNVVNQMNSIITTDDIRIREFAYLIGLGMFYAPEGQTQGDEVLTSLASSSLSAALNNALSSVLKDKVTIGTGFSTSDENFSDVEMNLSVSTKLLNDRLLLSTNLGYQKQATGEENEASFLGDFDAEYLLGKKKVLRVKAYNHTNNDYYRASSNTQGVGVVFVKESKTLRGLLPFAKDEEGKNLLAPRDTTQVKREEKNDVNKKERRRDDEK